MDLALIRRRRDVDQEFPAIRRPGAVIALSVDAPTITVLTQALPGDDGVAGSVHGDDRRSLLIRVRLVDLELTPLGHAGAVVLLSVDAPAIAIQTIIMLPSADLATLGLLCVWVVVVFTGIGELKGPLPKSVTVPLVTVSVTCTVFPSTSPTETWFPLPDEKVSGVSWVVL